MEDFIHKGAGRETGSWVTFSISLPSCLEKCNFCGSWSIEIWRESNSNKLQLSAHEICLGVLMQFPPKQKNYSIAQMFLPRLANLPSHGSDKLGDMSGYEYKKAVYPTITQVRGEWPKLQIVSTWEVKRYISDCSYKPSLVSVFGMVKLKVLHYYYIQRKKMPTKAVAMEKSDNFIPYNISGDSCPIHPLCTRPLEKFERDGWVTCLNSENKACKWIFGLRNEPSCLFCNFKDK